MKDRSITAGAQIIAAARAQGLTNDQTMRMILKAQRNASRKYGRDVSLTEAEAAVLKRLQQVGQVNADIPEILAELNTVDNSVVAYGEEGNQDTLQNFGGIDKQGKVANPEQAQDEIAKAKGKKDPNVVERRVWDKVDKKYKVAEEMYIPDGMPMPQRFKEDAKARDFGLQAPNQYAPAQQVLMGELARLQEGIDKYGADAFPGAASVAGRIEDDLYGARGAERSLVREMVARDRAKINPVIVEVNNIEAQIEAERNIREGYPDAGLNSIGQVNKIGPAKVGYDFNVSNNPVDRGTAMPGALPLNLPDQYNAPATDNRFVGPLQKQEQWLANNTPGYREGGAFGDYPQIAINDQLNAVKEGLKKIQIGGQGIAPGLAQIRNIDDLQRAADAVIALGAANNAGFFKLENGKNVAVANPGINEVLQKIGFNDNRKRDLAGALYAMQIAQGNTVNMMEDGRIYGGMQLNQGVPIARAGNAKIEGKEVAGQLQALTGNGRTGKGSPDVPLNAQELAQARMPFIAGIQGEPIKRALFLRGKGVNMTPEQRVAAFGDKNAAIANRLERERNILAVIPKGAVDPANPPAGSVDQFAEQLRGKDAEIAQLASIRNAEANAREINEAFERMGMPLEGRGQMLLGGQIVPDPIERPERNRVPDSVANNPKLNAKAGEVRDIIGQPVPERFAEKIAAVRAQYAPAAQVSSQQATSAVVNPVRSVSPEMSNGGIPPQPPAFAVAAGGQDPERRMSNEMLGTLAQLNSGPTQGPRTPGIRQKIMNSIKRAPNNFRSAPRYQRYGAVGGGALLGAAGLSDLINGERDKREEEQYR